MAEKIRLVEGVRAVGAGSTIPDEDRLWNQLYANALAEVRGIEGPSWKLNKAYMGVLQDQAANRGDLREVRRLEWFAGLTKGNQVRIV